MWQPVNLIILCGCRTKEGENKKKEFQKLINEQKKELSIIDYLLKILRERS